MTTRLTYCKQIESIYTSNDEMDDELII